MSPTRIGAAELLALSPLLALAAAAVLVMLAVAARRAHGLAFGLTLAGLAASLALLVPAARQAPLAVTALLVIDRTSLYYIGLLTAATLAVALLAWGYLARRGGPAGEGAAAPAPPEEFYILLLTAALGAGVIACSAHYVAFFLGLEILSVSLYSLVAYLREEEHSVEGGLKYLVLAGVSSAFLLFGTALIYAATGTLRFGPLAAGPEAAAPGGAAGALLASASGLAAAGMALFGVGVGFKLAAVPFHMWTPDVYQGAPLPVTAFIATVSKGAILAMLLRWETLIGLSRFPALVLALAVISAASMFVGNLLALFQDNLKRLLAYSSISHVGYLLVALLAGAVGAEGAAQGAGGQAVAFQALAFYLAAYFITTLGAFGVLAALSRPGAEVETLEGVAGLAWRRPWLAGVLTLMLLSLAGLPLTVGFAGKIYVLAAGADARLWTLAVLLVVNSAIGLYYYLRVVVALFSPVPAAVPVAAVQPHPPPVAVPAGLTLAALAVILVALGVYPAPLVRLIAAALAGGP